MASYFLALILKNVYVVVEVTYYYVKRIGLPVTNVVCPVANNVLLLSARTLVAMNVNEFGAMNVVLQNCVKKIKKNATLVQHCLKTVKVKQRHL